MSFSRLLHQPSSSVIKADLLGIMGDYTDKHVMRPKMMIASPLYKNNAFRIEEQNRVLEALTGKQIVPVNPIGGPFKGIETGTMPFKVEAPRMPS